MRLRLRHVSFSQVEFVLVDEQGRVLRPVVVTVASGSTWHEAVMFPSLGSEGSTSTGDSALDFEIRERAGDELVRLEAAVAPLREGTWAA
jgi:hypothetical protein